jgi:hypothetical protein
MQRVARAAQRVQRVGLPPPVALPQQVVLPLAVRDAPSPLKWSLQQPPVKAPLQPLMKVGPEPQEAPAWLVAELMRR